MRITDAAAEKIKEHLNAEDMLGLKIVARPGGCAGMMYKMGLESNPGSCDVLEVNGISVFVDGFTKQVLEDATLDYDAEQDGFHIDNPKFSGCSSCPGCH